MTLKDKAASIAKAEPGSALFDPSVYEALPVDYHGAPNFLWRKCETPEEQRVIFVENASRSAMYSPWFYPITLFAERIVTDFPKLFSEGKDAYGDVELYFSTDELMKIAVIWHLIHVRAPQGGHRIRVILPQTAALTKIRSTLNDRLGRVREPLECMRFLLVKNIAVDVSEAEVQQRFPHHGPIEIMFQSDALGQRCAVLKFSSAELAAAAHATNNFISLKSSSGGETTYRLLFAYVHLNRWGCGLLDDPPHPTALLTVSEVRDYESAQKIKAAS